MKTLVGIALLCVCMLDAHVASAKRPPVVAIYINSPDSSVHAHVMEEQVTIKAAEATRYYWYNRNAIFSSEGGFSGRLLHGLYTSYYAGKGLLWKGEFSKGVKTGTWIRWYINGVISEKLQFKNGHLHGAAEYYDTSGVLTMRIYYRKGVRAGKTIIFSQDNSDSVIRFKKGVAIPDKSRPDSADKKEKNKSRHIAHKTDSSRGDSLSPGKRKKLHTAEHGENKTGSTEKKSSAKQTANGDAQEAPEKKWWRQWFHRKAPVEEERKPLR